MEDSDDEILGPSLDDVSLNELHRMIGQLESREASRQTSFEPQSNVIHDRSGMRQPTNANYECLICSDTSTVVRLYGVFCCNACKSFLYSVRVNKRKLYCFLGNGSCNIHFTQRPVCHYCRLKRAFDMGISHPDLSPETNLHPLPSSSASASAQEQEEDIFPQSSSPPLDTTNASQGTSNSTSIDDQPSTSTSNKNEWYSSWRSAKVCRICGKSKKVYKAHGFDNCQNCRTFIDRRIQRPILVPCPEQGNCDITHTREVKCQACRWAKVLRQPDFDPGFDKSLIPPVPSRSESKYDTTNQTMPEKNSPEKSAKMCQICEFGLRLERCFGIRCCKKCYQFVRRTVKLNKSYNCIVGDRKCKIEHQGRIDCASCRWAKALTIPTFTGHEKMKSKHFPGASSQESAENASDEPPVNNASPGSSFGREDSSKKFKKVKKFKKICFVCEFSDNVLQCYGFSCCLNCRSFIARTIRLDKTYECLFGGSCVIELRKPIACSACRWAKAASHPNFTGTHLMRSQPSSQQSESTTRDNANLSSASQSSNSQATSQSAGQTEESLDASDKSYACGTGKRCAICNYGSYLAESLGFTACQNCRKLVRQNYPLNVSFICPNGGRCDVTYDASRTAKCSACRWSKIMEQPRFIHRQHFAKLAKQETITKDAFDGESIAGSRPATPSFVDRDNEFFVGETANGSSSEAANLCNDFNRAQERADEIDQEEHRGDDTVREEQAKNQAMLASEFEKELDQAGLPIDINERFSRWFYGDFYFLQPLAKDIDQEVKLPTKKKKVLTISNQLDSNFTYITSDLKKGDDLEELDELSTTVLEIIPSVDLAAARVASLINQHESIHCTPEKKSKRILTLMLNHHRTTVDRRPLIERIKVNSSQETQRSDTSLIGPGEDCDTGEDDIIEIDCD